MQVLTASISFHLFSGTGDIENNHGRVFSFASGCSIGALNTEISAQLGEQPGTDKGSERNRIGQSMLSCLLRVLNHFLKQCLLHFVGAPSPNLPKSQDLHPQDSDCPWKVALRPHPSDDGLEHRGSYL